MDCAICGSDARGDYEWRDADCAIGLPTPPRDLHSTPICTSCYRDGRTMETRIRDAGRVPPPPCSACGAPAVRFPAAEAYRLEDLTAAWTYEEQGDPDAPGPHYFCDSCWRKSWEETKPGVLARMAPPLEARATPTSRRERVALVLPDDPFEIPEAP